MTRIALFVIRLVTPPADREWVIGDTLEELERIRQSHGNAAARRWLHREMWRVILHAPPHHLARRLPALSERRESNGPALSERSESKGEAPINKGDGPVRDFLQDVRYTLRLLGRSPGFTAVAVLTLALGIGANTAIFAVVNAVLLKPLPFKDADRLMLVHLRVPQRSGEVRDGIWSYPKYRMLADAQQSFEDIAFFAPRAFDLAGAGEPERVSAEVVSERYPAVLGIAPLVGRPFSYEEVQQDGHAPSALIGHSLWTRRFGGAADILGRSIRINGKAFTIAGVLPAGFRGLNGNAELWVPLAVFEFDSIAEPGSHSYSVVARRKASVTEAAAIAEVNAIGSRIDAKFRDTSVAGSTAWGATARSLYASRVDPDVRLGSFVLLGAVGFVLLIACVNLTNLVAAKAMTRRREVAVRVAIGASRGRIVRQFLAEGLVLAFCGGAAGLLMATLMLKTAGAVLPESDVFFRTAMSPGAVRTVGAAGLTRIGAAMIGVDGATLTFTAIVALVTALLVSLMPAVQASGLRPIDALKSSVAGGRGGRRWLDARGLLVAAEIALALILLAGAGLMIRSAERLRGTGVGVNAEGVLSTRVDLFGDGYDAARAQIFHTQLLERVRAIPGVESAGLMNCAPVSGGCNGTIMWFPPAPRRGGNRDPFVGIHWASPGYFSTLGIRLIRGRLFDDRDRAGQPKVALVNEAAVRANWPNEDPIGKRIAVGQGGFQDGAEIIGIVSDVRYTAIESAPTPDVYIPIAQSGQRRMRLFVRSSLDSRSLAPAIAREVRALDPNLPMSEIKTMDQRLGDAMWRTRVSAWLLSAFAALALLLTAIGIFGVMTQAVAQRTAEIGIRMALGAQTRDVLTLVLGRAALVTAAGIVIGVAAALALTRLMTALLYGVKPGDPATFAVVAGLLGVIALVAGYIPARKATRVDAIAALRAE